MTGLQLYKLLPKTNCGDCGYATCLAFGMAVSAGKSSVEKCVHLSEDTLSALQAKPALPVKEISFSRGEKTVKMGGEKVLFRHEESFYNETAFAMSVGEDDGDPEAALEEISRLVFDRAGASLAVNALAVRFRTASFADRVLSRSDLPLILICEDAVLLAQIAAKAGKPMIWCPGLAPEEMAALGLRCRLPVIISAESAEWALAFDGGGAELAFCFSGLLKEEVRSHAALRRTAVKTGVSVFPSLTFLDEGVSDEEQMMAASALVNRYAGLLALSCRRREYMLPLLTQRHNIYTDPRKPIQVEPGLYGINGASLGDPLLVTTNFSLTYYLVSGEIEASRIPCWLLVTDTDGTSLLTAWAADKFNGESIAASLKKYGAGERAGHRRAVISSYVSSIKGEAEKLSDWRIEVGPADASAIPAFLKNYEK